MSNAPSTRRDREEQSLDVVQRLVISALIFVVFGLFAAVLGVYLVVAGDRDLPRVSVVGLWGMTGVFGVVTAVAILLVNRRRPYHPLVLLGLVPMAATWYWIFH